MELETRQSSSLEQVAEQARPERGARAASRAGLIDLAQSPVSDHVADGIRVNALWPGSMVTPAEGEGNPDVLDFIANLRPMKRMQAKEIAQAALFLLSDRSSFVTGSPMIVDGGISVRLT